VISTPYRAPNASAYVEWWIRSVREECLDKVLIINQAHLQHVMHEYVEFFSTACPHQGLAQHIPIAQLSHVISDPVRYRNMLGDMLHDYYRDST